MNVCARVCVWVIGGWVCGYGGGWIWIIVGWWVVRGKGGWVNECMHVGGSRLRQACLHGLRMKTFQFTFIY